MKAPTCRVCNQPDWTREPHILPKNAKGEVRSNRAAKTNGADTNCRTLRTDPRTSEGVPGTGRRGMNGQRLVSGQGIVRPTQHQRREAKTPIGGKRTAGRSADCSSLRIPAQVGETPTTNNQRAPAKASADQTKAEKVTPGKRQTAPKKKARKKVKKHD